MKDEGRSIKFQLVVSPTELAAVDEYRWVHRLRSRAEAVRQLVAIGVAKKAKGPVGSAIPPSHDHNQPTQMETGNDA